MYENEVISMSIDTKKTISIIILSVIILLSFSACQSGRTEDTSTPANEQVSDVSSNDSTNQSSSKEDTATAENYVEKLKSEGADIKDIEASQLYVKRIILQLSEIQTFSDSIGLQPAVNIDLYSEETDDSMKYSELFAKIDEDKAVYYLVKLKSSFGSLEEVFDEYLLSLQLDIDLDTYLTNKNSYDKLREEKLSGIMESSLITVRKIETKAFENLQKLNDSNKANYPGNGNDIYNPSDNTGPNVVNPQPDLPQVDIPRPIDPTEEINRRLSPLH